MGKLKSLAGYSTKAQLVYEGLREAIVSGEFAPGTHLIIDRIAEEMKVSESPVREAIRRLQSDGLIDFVPYAGAVVTSIDAAQVAETLELRAIVEGYATGIAAENMDTDTVLELERLVQLMSEKVAEGALKQYSRLNREFHQTVHTRCPSRKIRALLDSLMVESERTRALFLADPPSALLSNDEHREIVKRLAARDVAGSEAMMRQHQLRVAREFANKVRRSHTDG